MLPERASPRFSDYDDPREEQARAARMASEARRRAQAREELTEEHVRTIVEAKEKYPWVSTSVVVALARYGASMRVIEHAAMAEARSKSEHRRTNGKVARWSGPGDVVPGLSRPGATAGQNVSITNPARIPLVDRALGAVNAVEAAPGRAVGAVQDFGQNVGRIVSLADPRGRTQFDDGDVDREAQQAALPIAEGVALGRGAVRAGLAVAQTPIEVATGAARTGIASGGVFQLPGQDVAVTNPFGEVASQTTIGAAVEDYRESGKVRLGSGWFPAGEAQKRQARNSREVLEVDGHAWTLGRGVASLIVEPGTRPYNILSGLIDIGPQVIDPGALGLKALGRSRAARGALATLTSEADLARAIDRADPEWRAVVEEAVGLIGGTRPTVVPRVVDKALFSKWGQKVSEDIADEKSPYNIWLRSDKKMPVDVAHQLSRIDEPGEVAAALRPHLGWNVQRKDFKGFPMQKVHDVQAQLRALNVVPDTYLPFDNPELFVRNLDNSLANANVMGEDRRAVMDMAIRALASGGPGARKRVLNAAAKAVRTSLVSYGVPDEVARDLTTWTAEIDKIRKYLTDGVGNDINFNFLVDEAGNPITRPQPAALVDLLHSGAFLYDPEDVRKIRTLTSKLRPLTTNPGFTVPHSTINFFQQVMVKPLLPARAAFFLRVEGEAIARALASGTFDSVFDWLHFGRSQRIDAKGGWFDLAKEQNHIAERLATEVLDDDTRKSLRARIGQINEELDQGKSEFDAAKMGRLWKYADFYAIEKSLRRSGNWVDVHKASDPRRWARGLADDMIRISQDPIIRRVANGGLFEGDKVPNARPGLDGIKDWLRSGTGRKFLRQFEDAYPGYSYESEGVLSDIIDKARLRVEQVGPNDDLREAIATGMFNGKALASKTRKGRVASDELLARLREWAADPRSHPLQKYEQTLEEIRTHRGDTDDFIDGVSVVFDNFYGYLYGRGTDYLSRERVFKGKYWKEIEQLTPFMTEAARDEMLVNAAEAGVTRSRLRRLAEAAKQPAGEADLEAADMIARGRALDYTRSLLYDGSRKAQASDIFRAVFLYPEAWREVTGTWMKLALENPQIPRRVQQGIQGARGAGFFYRDEVSGQEMFGYELPPQLTDYFGVEFQGSAAGLSLGTSIIPGMSPVASVAANRLIPHTPDMDVVREFLFPYGEPSDLPAAGIPGWMKKLYGATFPDPDNDRMFGNTYIEVLRQLHASGKYGMTEIEKERLLADAIPKARAIVALRGILQFFVPSAPQVRYIAETKQGDVVAALLAKDLHEMQEDDEIGYDGAVEAFFEKYGEDAFAYLVGKTRSTVGGQEASTEYGQWERENEGFISTYDLVAGYFGPQGEGYNSTVFQRQEKQGKRDRRTPEEIIDDAQSMLASWIWRQESKKVEGRTDEPALEWKRQVKAEIREEFPAWDPDRRPVGLTRRIDQLRRASQDERVKDDDVAFAVQEYFSYRQQAIDAAKEQGWTSPFKAKRAAYLRNWLRTVAAEITEDFPEFGRVWDQVLSYELVEEEVAA